MAELRAFETPDTSADLFDEIRRLLIDAFDGDFSDDDWANACGGTHVIAVESGRVVAHASVVPRTLDVGGVAFRTGYVEGVGTLAARRREGLGSIVMVEIDRIVRRDFELGALSTGRHPFYERLGWECWRGRTFVRDGERIDHTPDDDDSVMVLRFDTSATIDLTSSITCEMRLGDPW
jgi:aminoglycoside 2'-N-acetyltransferase I